MQLMGSYTLPALGVSNVAGLANPQGKSNAIMAAAAAEADPPSETPPDGTPSSPDPPKNR